MRIVVLGANGGTGRRLVQQALDAGHEVRAATRQPQSFPIRDPGLEVQAADVRVEAPTAGAERNPSRTGRGHAARQCEASS